MKLAVIAIAGLAMLQAPPLTKAEQLQEAARKGDAATVRKLIDDGVDVNTKFRYGATALFYAADHGNLEVVKVLLEKGADLTLKDTFYGFTPLMLAMSPAQTKKPEHTEIAKLLIAKGAPGKEDALAPSLREGDMALAKVILDSGGIPPDVLSDALEGARDRKQADAIALLEKSGAKPFDDFKLDAAQLARFAGTYKTSTGGEVVIVVAQGRLVGTPTGGDRAVLVARDARTFRVIGEPASSITFAMDGEKVTGFALAAPGRPAQTYTRVEGKQP